MFEMGGGKRDGMRMEEDEDARVKLENNKKTSAGDFRGNRPKCAKSHTR